MDNNPFRNHQPSQPNVSNTGFINQQAPAPPPPVNNNFGYTSPPLGNTYPQQQQAWQNNPITTTPYSQSSTTNYHSPLQTTPLSQSAPYSTPYSAQNGSFTSASTYTPSFQPTSPYNNTSLMSSNHTPTSGVLGTGNTYQPYQASSSMPTPNMSFQPSTYQPPQQSPYQTQPSTFQQQPIYGMNPQQQYGMGMNQPTNNFFIPDNFGQSTPQQQHVVSQPKHAPVDATTLLKGTQVRRVECPVCQKMIEGDDMAVNHHVNEHYS